MLATRAKVVSTMLLENRPNTYPIINTMLAANNMRNKIIIAKGINVEFNLFDE